MIYYTDQPNPPLEEHEPAFEGTRRLLEHEKLPSLYLNIRYPVQKEPKGKVQFLLSVGHELKDMALFEIKKLELQYEGKALLLKPSFLNQASGQTESGMEAVMRYRHRVPPYDHRRIQVVCENCTEEMETLTLDVAVLIMTSKGQTTLKDTIDLYRGRFRLR